jgi:hypothetical protein
MRPSSKAEIRPRGHVALERGGDPPEGHVALERGRDPPEGVRSPRSRRRSARGMPRMET